MVDVSRWLADQGLGHHSEVRPTAMSRGTEARLRRLEQRREAEQALDPADLCARALAFYEMGPEAAPLPPDLRRSDRELVAAFLDMLVRSAEPRWWSDLPLPLDPIS